MSTRKPLTPEQKIRVSELQKIRRSKRTPEQIKYENERHYEYVKHNPDKVAKRGKTRSDYAREYRHRLRIKVLNGLSNGDIKCVCCGESEIDFMTIDHINGGGAIHRRSNTGRSKNMTLIYLEIIREGIPKDKYRVLCFNCNCAIGKLGYCPHERKNK